MKSDIEIARSVELLKIDEIADAYGIDKDHVIHYGNHMAKVDISGDIMRMPGLPKNPQALRIDIVDGNIEGLS